MKEIKNLFSDSLSAAEVAGVRCRNDTVICERLSVEDTAQSDNIFQTEMAEVNRDSVRQPMVFKVLACGPKVEDLSVGDLVCMSFLAGDEFESSPIVVCSERDITFVWGSGIFVEE